MNSRNDDQETARNGDHPESNESQDEAAPAKGFDPNSTGENTSDRTDNDRLERMLVTRPRELPELPPERRGNTGPLAQNAGPTRPAARWVASLSNPNVSAESRALVDSEFVTFIERNSTWACAFFAGLVHDLTWTLPDEDPWRHLSAVIDLDEVNDGHPTKDKNRRLARVDPVTPLPLRTGAVHPDLRWFGTRADAEDLITPSATDLYSDPMLADVAQNLSPLGASVVAFGSMDVKTILFVLRSVHHELWLSHFSANIAETAAQAMLDTCGSAVRWLLHRRRAYLGAADEYPAIAGFAWIQAADQVTRGEQILDQPSTVGEGKIDNGSWAALTQPPSADELPPPPLEGFDFGDLPSAAEATERQVDQDSDEQD